MRFGSSVEPAAAASVALHRCQRRVDADGLPHEQAVLFAVFGRQANARPDRVGRLPDGHGTFFITQRNLSMLLWVGTKNGAQGFGAARTDKSGQPENFAAPHF